MAVQLPHTLDDHTNTSQLDVLEKLISYLFSVGDLGGEHFGN